MKTDAARPVLDSPKADTPAESERKKRPFLRFLSELPGLVLVALFLALLIKTFLVQAFYIPSPSMEPTLVSGDRVLVTKIPYYLHDPERGDVIVFADPDPKDGPDRGIVGGFFHWLVQGLGVQKPDHEDFIKRVIGLPGDVVQAKEGKVYVNGLSINEPYLDQKTRDFPKTSVPDDMLFVMGDNRGNSLDSRFGLGFIPMDNVIGKAFVIIWPPSNMSGL